MKPSERIEQIEIEMFGRGLSLNALEVTVLATIKYLDEQWETGEQSGLS